MRLVKGLAVVDLSDYCVDTSIVVLRTYTQWKTASTSCTATLKTACQSALLRSFCWSLARANEDSRVRSAKPSSFFEVWVMFFSKH